MTSLKAVPIPQHGVFRLLRLPTQVVILNTILPTIPLSLVSVIYSLTFSFSNDLARRNRHHFLRWLGRSVLRHIRVPWDMCGETHEWSKLCGKTNNIATCFLFIVLPECVMEYKLLEGIQKAVIRRKYYQNICFCWTPALGFLCAGYAAGCTGAS